MHNSPASAAPAAALLAVVFSLMVPSVAAQVPDDSFTFTLPAPDGFLDPAAPTTLTATLVVGCVHVFESPGGVTVTFTAEAPDWLNVSAADVPITADACLGASNVTLDVPVVLTPAPDAPGLAEAKVHVGAVIGSHEAPAETHVTLDYLAGHTLDPAGDQTFQVTDTTYTFDLTLDIQANAKTMMMFEDKTVSGGSLTGLRAYIFDVEGGERQKVNEVVFSVPEGDWTQETVTFYNYSHCLDGPDCGEQGAATLTWTFVNDGAPVVQPAGSPAAPAGGDAATDDDSDADKGLPAPGIAVTLVALVGLALRRRQA